MDSTGPKFANILAGSNNVSLDAFFQKCKTFPGKIILHMWWEMNCTGGPTKISGGNLCSSAAQWKQTWQYVCNRCKVTNGCTNVTFFWCANGTDIGTTKMEDLYPGMNYVDIVGFDTYNETTYGNWESFDTRFVAKYDRIAAFNTNSPFAVGETGCVPSDPTNAANTEELWFRQLFTSQQMPRLRDIDFFSVNKEYDWRINRTAATTTVCRLYLPTAPVSALT